MKPCCNNCAKQNHCTMFDACVVMPQDSDDGVFKFLLFAPKANSTRNAIAWVVGAVFCAALLANSIRNDLRLEKALQAERTAALCVPGPGEIAHTSYEPDGSLRCAVTRRGQLVTRMEIDK